MNELTTVLTGEDIVSWALNLREEVAEDVSDNIIPLGRRPVDASSLCGFIDVD